MFHRLSAPSIWFADHDLDPRITAGVGSNFEGRITVGLWLPDNGVTIGSFSSVGRETYLMGGGNHYYDHATTWPIKTYYSLIEGHGDVRPTRPLNIGSDVWIGVRSMLLPGTDIGHGCVIGAGAVVKGSFPPYSIIAGNPAKVIGRRFDDATAERLLDLAWWDWPISKVVANADLLQSPPSSWPADLDIVEPTTTLEFPPKEWRYGARQSRPVALARRIGRLLRDGEA